MQTMDDLLQFNVYTLPKRQYIIYTILHYEGMHTITQLVCLICPIKCDYTKLRCYVMLPSRLLNYNYNWVRVN